MAKTLSRSAILARELLGMIARRELQPGDPIDLQALGRRHGVSRTVVREALADLGGKGLVVARPKVGTAVAPASQWNLLDPGLVAVAAAQTGPASMLAEATELRRVIEPALAADAACSASSPQRMAVLDAVRATAGAVGRADRIAAAAGEVALHDAIAAACANRLLQSIDRTLAPVRALHRERLHSAQFLRTGVGAGVLRLLALYTELALAIVRRDGPSAAGAALAIASAAQLESAAGPAARPRVGAALGQPDAGIPIALRQPIDTAGSARGSDVAIFARTGILPDADAGTDWPDTTVIVRVPDMLAPVRRARLDPLDDPGMPMRARPGGSAGTAPSFSEIR
jgi:DNA-binding FadR family transcriptional regulator